MGELTIFCGFLKNLGPDPYSKYIYGSEVRRSSNTNSESKRSLAFAYPNSIIYKLVYLNNQEIDGNPHLHIFTLCRK